jgi:hypothetical protein
LQSRSARFGSSTAADLLRRHQAYPQCPVAIVWLIDAGLEMTYLKQPAGRCRMSSRTASSLSTAAWYRAARGTPASCSSVRMGQAQAGTDFGLAAGEMIHRLSCCID